MTTRDDDELRPSRDCLEFAQFSGGRRPSRGRRAAHVLALVTGYVVGDAVASHDAVSWSAGNVSNGGDVLALVVGAVVATVLWRAVNWLTR